MKLAIWATLCCVHTNIGLGFLVMCCYVSHPFNKHLRVEMLGRDVDGINALG